MLKACPYCKKIHPIGFICPLKPTQKKNNDITVFRSSKQWQRKRGQIRRRDGYMCRMCAVGYGDEPVRYNSEISVHHIESLASAWEKRLDDDNLICLCSYHHERAESGKIEEEFLKKLAVSDIFSPSHATLK